MTTIRLQPRPSSTVVETKVALPAVVVGCASVLASALYALARAYGFDPTQAQHVAIAGVGTAVQFITFVVVGYLAPHTPRPDIPHDDQPPARPDVPSTAPAVPSEL